MPTIYLLSKITGPLDQQERDKIENSLSDVFGTSWRDVGNGSYLVSADSTLVTEDISNKIGISEGNMGEYIVTALQPFYGFGPNSNWEWISSNG